jgi:hypothetical protein
MTTWNSESKENVDRPSKTWGLLSVVWLLLKDLGIYKAIQLIISMQKQIILNNIYIGWFCLKIMLQEDKCIYIEWRENLACTNSYTNCTEDNIIKMMNCLIDTIFVVFGEMMLQQTMHNMKYNWNEQTIHLYLAFKKFVCAIFVVVFVCNARVTRNLYLNHIIKNVMVDTMCGCICNQLFTDILWILSSVFLLGLL